jgi:hypothetical protein
MSISTIRDGAPLRRLTLALLGVLALIALGGCGIFAPDEADEGGGKVDADFPIPLVDNGAAGRDQVITNLENAYIELDYDEYERLIHDDYVFIIDPTEIDIVGVYEYSAAEDLASTKAMFERNVGIEKVVDDEGKPTGETEIVPPVDTVDLRLPPESASSWEFETDGRFQGAWKRIHNVNMTIEYQGGERIDQIVGLQTFHVMASTQTRTVDGQEVELEVWQLVGWEDQGINTGQ